MNRSTVPKYIKREEGKALKGRKNPDSPMNFHKRDARKRRAP